MLREQFMLSKKMYYSYLLNFIDEYWRNIYLKFRERIRKTSMLVMTINNVFYKAHIKTNRTNRTTRTSHSAPSSDTTRLIHTSSSSDTTRPIHTQDQLETNKGNKCIPYDNLIHLIFRMKVLKIKDKKAIKINKNKVKNCLIFIKGMIAIRKDKAKKAKDNLMNLVIKIKAKPDKIFINSIKNLLANAAYKSENKQIKHKGIAMLVKLIECEKLKEKDKSKKTKKTKKTKGTIKQTKKA
ncbi:MAG: hypothetical protein CBB97_02560 [Candidatus Endolissoclinum sp. TMED37]|nr:MAG: hypothetical protein CBB97_02560 [Candidatus Endolissoclinum sp. TMED37]|tara:strand:+ start:1158 stop:1874 length:717 start_codon:yes stop_codon:yes gene_type:complete